MYLVEYPHLDGVSGVLPLLRELAQRVLQHVLELRARHAARARHVRLARLLARERQLARRRGRT